MWINYVNKYFYDDVYIRLLCVQVLKDNNCANQLPSLVYADMKIHWNIIYKGRDLSNDSAIMGHLKILLKNLN